jgi:hypothetical protein
MTNTLRTYGDQSRKESFRKGRPSKRTPLSRFTQLISNKMDKKSNDSKSQKIVNPFE